MHGHMMGVDSLYVLYKLVGSGIEMELKDLRIEYRNNPIGLDLKAKIFMENSFK